MCVHFYLLHVIIDFSNENGGEVKDTTFHSPKKVDVAYGDRRESEFFIITQFNIHRPWLAQVWSHPYELSTYHDRHHTQ